MKHGYCLTGKAFPTVVDSIILELELLKQAGYSYAEIDTDTMLSFTTNDIQKLRAAALPIEVANCFVPGKYHVCDALQAGELHEHVELALSQASRLGVAIMVFGSGGARRVPEGMSIEEGTAQIADFLRDCNDVAVRNNVTIAVEPLNHNECNILLSVRETARLVRSLGLSHIKLLADTYHMSVDNEDEGAILENIDIIEHIHIAEDLTREYPGAGESKLIRATAEVLKASGYDKRITVESKVADWGKEIILSKKVLAEAY